VPPFGSGEIHFSDNAVFRPQRCFAPGRDCYYWEEVVPKSRKRKLKSSITPRPSSSVAHRDPYRTSRFFLKCGLALLFLDGMSLAAFIRLARTRPPGIGALWSGEAVLVFTTGVALCFMVSLLFWADKKWHVYSRWEWPKRKTTAL
jgi:hypothetical protein